MSRGWPRTLPEALESASEATETGIRFASQGDRFVSYARIVSDARRRATGLVEAGIEPGDRLLVILPTGLDLVSQIFATSLAGAVPALLSPPQGFGSRSIFQRRLEQVVEVTRTRTVVVDPSFEEEVASLLPTGVKAITTAASMAPSAFPAARPEDPAFIQFTSGTSRHPRGIVISHRALSANLEQIANGSAIEKGSTFVSWLPLFHDMGLVGGLLTPLWGAHDLSLSDPGRFLRRPRTWLEAIGRRRATHSPAPTFAYRHVVDRLADDDLTGIDLSSWRVAYVGAEPIPAWTLDAFARRCAPLGFDRRALLPCYGMAETTLAATLADADRPYRVCRVDPDRLARDGRAEPPAEGGGEMEIVSCGRALPGTEVKILDADGGNAPDRSVGEIVLRGPSLLSETLGDAEGSPSPEEWFRTGDLGFLVGGELHVSGRAKDLIILRGENHHPAEIEWALAGFEGVREGRVAALGIEDPGLGTETLCLVAERNRRTSLSDEEIVQQIRRRVHERTGLTVAEVELVRSGTIPTTTSGKIQRGLARELFLTSRSPAS